VRTHYELLDLGPDAGAEEIKKAFRREIARYHPDKVQHLGPEFQQIASVRAAELTEAYRVLMDEALRAEYDERLKNAPRKPAESGASSGSPAPASASGAPASEPATAPSAAADAEEPARPKVDRPPSDFVRKVGTSRLRDAVATVAPGANVLSFPAFDMAFDIKGKGGLFKKGEPPVRLLIRFVPQVDRDAIAASWLDAIRAAKCQEHTCVLMLLGAAGVAETKELSAAVADQRRKSRGTPIVVVPVDVRDWEALFPPDTPSSVRGIMQWLQQGSV
jgi:curved DNA-binding protein CbpA